MSGRRLLAVAAQFTQAGTSLALSLIAVRTLTPVDFGRFALVLSTLVVMTGLVTGLVGDSLTVLDRQDPRIRFPLQIVALAAPAACAIFLAGLGVASEWFKGADAAVVMAATATFLVEDTGRRSLMAANRFWAVIIVDVVYLGIACWILVVMWQHWGASFAGLFIAMAVGQAVAIIASIALLPRAERWVTRHGPGAWRSVLGFGGWRAAQGVIGPAKLWGGRILISWAAGLAAVGAVEANRLVVSPLLLAVQGLASAILVSYTRLFHQDPRATLKQSDRDAVLTFVMSFLAVIVIAWCAPAVGAVLLGSTEMIDRTLVVGWGVVAIGIGVGIPYSSLTAVSGSPRTVVMIRLLDGALSLLVVALLLTRGGHVAWVPWVLGAVTCAMAPLQRAYSRRSVSASLLGHTSTSLVTGQAPARSAE